MSIDRRDSIDAAAAGEDLLGPVRRLLRNAELDLSVSSPGTVVTYDPVLQTAVVTRGFIRIQDLDTPAGSVEVPWPPEPVHARVAVAQGVSHSDHQPILPGDTGTLFYSDRALDAWYRGGGLPADPGDARTHDQADALFVPGWGAPDALRSAPPINPTARTIDAPIIALGSAAVVGVDAVAIASQVHTYITAVIAAGLAAAVPGSADGGTAAVTAMGVYLAANSFAAFAATKVIAE